MYETTGISIIIGELPIQLKGNETLKYKHLLENNGFKTQDQLANHLQVSKARITQYLNLLKLDPEIVSYVSSLQKPSENCYITERFLRSIIKIKSSYLQKKKFFEMVNHFSN